MNIIRGKQQKPQKTVVYGPEGVGKSTFASRFPDPVFIDTEDSTVNMDVARFPKPTSWTMLLQQVTYVKANPTICKTLVIDTADWAERLCIEHICSKAQVDGIESFGYGKGYVYLEEEFGRFLNNLQEIIEIGINVVVTAHAEIKKIEQPEEIGGYDHWQMKLEKKTMPLLKEWADILLLANYKVYVVNVDNQGAQKGKNKAQGGQRVIHTTHSPWWDAKNRHNLPDELPFDYSQIAHIFENKPMNQSVQVKPPKNEPPKVESPKKTEIPNETKREVKQQEAVKPQETIKQPDDNLKYAPKALVDLMEANKVTIDEVMEAAAHRGYVTKDTPFKNYDPDFVKGCLIGAWSQVYNIILEIRKESDIFTPVTDPDEIPF